MPAIMGRKPKKADLSTYRKRFGARLRELRQRQYRRLDDWVDALQAAGVKARKSQVSGWENGQYAPNLEHWPAIAETLDVSIRSLLPTE